MSKSKMFEEALADAKAISKVALENAKLSLEEHFAPTLKKMVSSKLQESLEEEYEEDDDASTEDMAEAKKKAPEEKSEEDEKESEDEGLNLEALLKELESDDGEEEEDEEFGDKEKDGKKGVKPMDENLQALVDKLKKGAANAFDDFKKDFEALKDPKSRKEWLQSLSTTLGRIQGVSENGDDDIEDSEEDLDEEKAEYLKLKEKFEGKKKSEEEKPSEEEKSEDESDMDEDVDVESLLRELESGDEEDKKPEEEDEEFGDKEKDGKKGVKPMDEKAEMEKLKSEINEVNLINSKLIYFNKIVNESDNLSKTDKVALLKQFDKCATVNEAKLVYETISKVKKSTKKPSENTSKKALKESMSFSSKSAGTSTAKKQTLKEGEEIVNSELAKRWSFLAFGK